MLTITSACTARSDREDHTGLPMLIIPASRDPVNCFLALVRVSPGVLKGILIMVYNITGQEHA
jgi:hypothetical protein